MNEADLRELTAAVETVLENEDDCEAVWDQLGSAIAAWPASADLRRLRIRLSEATYDRVTRIVDLTALRELDPQDRDAILELAVLQHRWAYRLVDEDDSDDSDDDDDDDDDDGEDDEVEHDDGDDADDDEDDDADDGMEIDINVRFPQAGGADSAQAQLERQAIGWLTDLVNAQRGDADFCVKVFARWSEQNIYAPWLRLRFALELSAAHPQDARLERVLADAWADLSNQAPAGFEDGQAPPVGFLVDVFGALWDPFMIERALESYEALLERAPADPELLGSCARLRQAMFAFPDAAKDYDAAADATALAAEAVQDADERETMLAEAFELRGMARQCRGGRKALVGGGFDAIEQAMAQFSAPMTPRPDASETAKAWLQDWEQSSKKRMEDLAAEFGTLRAQQDDDATGPDEEQLAELESAALRIAVNVAGTLLAEPLEMRAIEPGAFEGDWAAQLQAFGSPMQELGWSFFGWAEWPQFRSMLGHQAVSGIWQDPATGTVALVTPVKGTMLVDIDSELEDGRQLVSSLTRGRNFLSGGPQVETLLLEPGLTLKEACEIHMGRLAQVVSRSPAARPLKPATLKDILAMQERARQAKFDFRASQGLTHVEALALPNDYPEVFVPMLQEAVRRQIALKLKG